MLQLADALTKMASLSDAVDAPDLHRRVQGLVTAIGCDHFLIGLEISRVATGQSVQHVDSGYPAAWQQRYAEKQYIKIDPTIGYCQTNTVPVVWSPALYESTKSIELMEEARSFGLGTGASIPVHQGSNLKSMFSVARDLAFADERETELVVSAAKVLANCAHIALTKIVMPSLILDQEQQLTDREMACLQLVARGKGSGVIADLLRISEPTVNYHLNKVMKKFRVATRVQAVAVAVQLGILQ